MRENQFACPQILAAGGALTDRAEPRSLGGGVAPPVEVN